MSRQLRFNPVDTINAWHFAEMLDIVCNNRQTIMTCCNGNQNIKVANNQSLASKCMANIGIITSPVFNDWKNLEVFHD